MLQEERRGIAKRRGLAKDQGVGKRKIKNSIGLTIIELSILYAKLGAFLCTGS